MTGFCQLYRDSDEPLRVLVTGGAGFLGHHLVRRLLAAGAEVTVLDDLSSGLEDRVRDVAGLRFVHGSVLDRAAVADAATACGLVLHLAAVVGMRKVYADPGHALAVSDEGTANVLAATGNVPAMLMSSSAVYGLEPRELASEADRTSWQAALEYDGGSPGYACGKLKLESHGFAAMETGRPVLMPRPFNVVGPGQRSSFGMVLPTFVKQARTGEPLVVYDDGLQNRSFGDVKTFADCILRLLCEPEAWSGSANPINVGSPTATSIRTLAQIVIEETGMKAPIRHVPYGSIYPGKIDVRHRRPETRRLEQLLGPVEWPHVRDIVRGFVAQA